MYNKQQNEDSQINSSPNSTSDQAAQTPTKKTRRKSLKHFTIILLVIGLILGGIFSVGIAKLLKQWGLTDDTPRLNQVRE